MRAHECFARMAAALILVGVAGFCVFGFLASYELSSAAVRFPWQAGYGLVGLMTLGTAAWLVIGIRRTR